jgi:cytochrome oxidase Cu insertion factor (SCO1/SenC/PrrC family)
MTTPSHLTDPPSNAGASSAAEVELTVHSMPRPDMAVLQRTRLGRIKMLLVLLVCASPVIASYLTFFVIRPEGRTNYSELIEPSRALPPLSELPLTDLQGRPVEPATLRGQWLLVVVAGGQCDAPCERALYVQRQMRESLGRERDRVDKVWLISDAEPVRPELLQAIASGTSPATVLRAPREALARWLTPAPGQTIEQHMLVVDPMGQWMMRAPADPDPSRLKRDLEKLLRASASWDLPGR